MVRCKSRRRDGTQCDGTATSQFYRVQQSWLRANDSLGMKRELQVHYAFYRPNNQISNLESVREHLLGGGLLFDTLAMALRLHDSSFVIASDFDVRNEQLRIEVLTALQRKYGPPIG